MTTISITPETIEEAKRLLPTREPEEFIRIGVKGGGCSGFAYVIQYDNLFKEDRDVVLFADEQGRKIFVTDKKSQIYLEGSQVIFKKTLVNRGFEIVNPQETSRCGCGKSFSV